MMDCDLNLYFPMDKLSTNLNEKFYLCRNDMRIVRIPEKHIRLQISGGKYTVRFDRKYFEKQNGPIDNKFFTTSCSDPYLMIYPTGTQCKIREKGHRKKK